MAVCGLKYQINSSLRYCTHQLSLKQNLGKRGFRLNRTLTRAYCGSKLTIPSSSKALVYIQYGDPANVISLQETTLPTLDEQSVFVRMLASPINPADLNMVQGTYPIKPSLPAVGGNEGVGEVLAVGGQVKDLKQGDWVIMANSGLGCWTEMNIFNQSDVLKLPRKEGVPVSVAATLSVNPCTAYRMLRDFETIKPGDVVLQNGGNSGVGEAVIQLASSWGLVSLSVVRKRPNFEEVKNKLMGLGATFVVTEEDFQNVNKMKDLLKNHPVPKLALNCVGGKSATQLLRYLSNQGTMVTYGGMSRKPITVPTSSFIFKDLRLRGFWMTRWNQYNSTSPERSKMLEELCQLANCGNFKPPDCETFKLEDFHSALQNSLKPFSKKSLFQFTDSKN